MVVSSRWFLGGAGVSGEPLGRAGAGGRWLSRNGWEGFRGVCPPAVLLLEGTLQALLFAVVPTWQLPPFGFCCS